MTKPLVSIITPTWNHAGYIGHCVESLLSQTHEHWEHIIVDDGSTDDTAQIVASYDDPRITYIAERHRGVESLAETMNIGFRQASGQFMTALMSDDMWPADRIESQIPVFEDDSVVLAFGRQALIGPNGEALGETPTPAFVEAVMNRPVGSILGRLLVNNFLPQPTVLIRSSAMAAIGGYLQPAGLLAEDYPTHLALALQGEFRFLDKVLGYYRQHPHQQTRTIQLTGAIADARFLQGYFDSLPAEIQRLTSLTSQSFEARLKKRVAHAYFSEGRRALLGKDRGRAGQMFRTALWRGGARTKAQAMVGWACAVLGLDLERVGRALGRTPIS